MRKANAFTLVELPAASRREGRAFTLVELLIVVSIIALLIALIMPSLGRARDLAKKAVCATTVHSHGKALAIYVSESDSYPVFSPFIWRCAMWWSNGSWSNDLQGWPKFYADLSLTRTRSMLLRCRIGPASLAVTTRLPISAAVNF